MKQILVFTVSHFHFNSSVLFVCAIQLLRCICFSFLLDFSFCRLHGVDFLTFSFVGYLCSQCLCVFILRGHRSGRAIVCQDWPSVVIHCTTRGPGRRDGGEAKEGGSSVSLARARERGGRLVESTCELVSVFTSTEIQRRTCYIRFSVPN